MTTNRKTTHKSDIRLQRIDSLSEAVHRRVRSKLLDLDEKSAKQNQALARQLVALRSEYRRSLSALMGASGMRRYRELRKKLAEAPRPQRIRESKALLEAIGFNRVRADRLRKQYLDTARRLLNLDDVRIPPRVVRPDTHCGPWVTYTAPYSGFFWSYAWSRSDEASNPALTRYLDAITGQIGSAIDTRLSGADDDDFVEAEYYTAFNTSHTALGTGQLEGYLAASFAQGSALVLQAGVWNSTWFFADDESIKTASDLNLRLDRIMVRSCPS